MGNNKSTGQEETRDFKCPRLGSHDLPLLSETGKQFHTKSPIGSAMKRGEEFVNILDAESVETGRFETIFIFPPDIARQHGGESSILYSDASGIRQATALVATDSEAVRHWQWRASAWQRPPNLWRRRRGSSFP